MLNSLSCGELGSDRLNSEDEIRDSRSNQKDCVIFHLDFSLATHNFTADTVLFELPDLLCCEIRRIDGTRDAVETRENYAARRAGSDFAIEAELSIPEAPKPEWQTIRIGYPLSELTPGDSLCWQFDGHALQLFCNGRVVNEDYVCAAVTTVPRLPDTALHPSLQYLRFGETMFRRDSSYPQIFTSPVHLWSPFPLNAWVGDTSTFTYGGEYHLFYLLDRRHHASKSGCGGHYWAHLASSDLKSWRDDGIVVAPENIYQTFGTGTPFLLNGQLALSYGLHTSRISTRTMTPLLRARVKSSGTSLTECDFSEGNGLLPEGATYAVAADGRHFIPSHKLFHWSQNPSIFQLSDGRYRLFCGNGRESEIWESRNWGIWRKIRSGFPPAGDKSFSGNNLDCPNYFIWHGTHYLLVGFSGMWMAQDEDFSDAVDLAERGEDLYDGLYVPMVSPHPCDPERLILAAWLPVGGAWGGVLGMRELVRHPDGVIGCRWLAESMPAAGDSIPAVPEDGTFYFETGLDRAQTIRFEGTEKAAEFRFNPIVGKAQLCFADSPEVQTARERALSGDRKFLPSGNSFAVGKLRLPEDGPTPVRLYIRYCRKWRGTIIDAEIAGCRTLIVFFAGLKVNRISGVDGVIRIRTS